MEELREDEAVLLFGVSAKTLIRFSEAGYLSPRKDPAGALFYGRRELCELFTPGRREDEPDELETAPASKSVSASELEKMPEPATAKAEVAPPPPVQATSAPGEFERAQLRHVIELHERLLEQQERELSDLREQRSWLQRRVEQLEQKAEKDQILLMTELQTVRQLVHQRRGLIETVREWFKPQLPAGSSADSERQSAP